jgi:hypothetical protein
MHASPEGGGRHELISYSSLAPSQHKGSSTMPVWRESIPEMVVQVRPLAPIFLLKKFGWHSSYF